MENHEGILNSLRKDANVEGVLIKWLTRDAKKKEDVMLLS